MTRAFERTLGVAPPAYRMMSPPLGRESGGEVCVIGRRIAPFCRGGQRDRNIKVGRYAQATQSFHRASLELGKVKDASPRARG